MRFRSAVETVAVHRLVHRRVGVSTAVVPRDICLRHRVVGRLVRADGSVPRAAAAGLRAACPSRGSDPVGSPRSRLRDRGYRGERGVPRKQRGQRDPPRPLGVRGGRVVGRLDGIESRGGVSWVAGEGIWRQTGGQVITHSTTVRRSGGSAPLVTRTRSVGGMVRTFE